MLSSLPHANRNTWKTCLRSAQVLKLSTPRAIWNSVDPSKVGERMCPFYNHQGSVREQSTGSRHARGQGAGRGAERFLDKFCRFSHLRFYHNFWIFVVILVVFSDSLAFSASIPLFSFKNNPWGSIFEVKATFQTT